MHIMHLASRVRLRWIVLALVAVILALVTLYRVNSAAYAQGAPSIDHFRCYAAKATAANKAVFLRDQFDATGNFDTVTVNNHVAFCNPTLKIHTVTGAIINPKNHLSMYRINSLFTTPILRTVEVDNQFGRQVFTTREARYLLVPTDKLSVDGVAETGTGTVQIDHFKCYGILNAPPRNVPVQLHDQFDRQTDPPNAAQATVLRPLLFCNPVHKIHVDFMNNNNVPIQDPLAHLTCYGMSAIKRPPRQLVTTNQFGSNQQVRSQGNSEFFCVPTHKLGWNLQGPQHSPSSSSSSSSSVTSSFSSSRQ